MKLNKLQETRIIESIIKLNDVNSYLPSYSKINFTEKFGPHMDKYVCVCDSYDALNNGKLLNGNRSINARQIGIVSNKRDNKYHITLLSTPQSVNSMIIGKSISDVKNKVEKILSDIINPHLDYRKMIANAKYITLEEALPMLTFDDDRTKVFSVQESLIDYIDIIKN